MSTFLSLAHSLEHSNAWNGGEQESLLRQVRALRDRVVPGPSGDPSGCLDAALILLEGRERLAATESRVAVAVAARLVRSAATFYADAAGTAPAASEEAAATGPRGPRRLRSGARDISDTRLRLVTDMVLGEMLVHLGHVAAEDLERAVEVQRACGMRIGEALVEIGATNWERIEEALRQQRGLVWELRK